jgi:hypothetical protein
VEIEILQQPSPDRLTGTSLKQDVIGQDDGSPAVDTENCRDVLDKVELLVRRGDDEVLPLNLAVLTGLPTVGADHGERGLATERRVGQHH